MNGDTLPPPDPAALERVALFQSPLPTMCVSARRGRYVFANDAYIELIGIPREELMARDAYEIWLEVTHPDDIPAERAGLERAARGEVDRFQTEKRIVRRGGEPRWVVADCVVERDEEARMTAIVVYFIDIDESRRQSARSERLETELRQAQKLGALGKLAGGVAHDFNNRLLIVMGHTELLRRGLPADGPLAHHAETVLASAQRAAELTRQLLAYGRRQVLTPEVFDLNHTVDRLRRMLERLIGEDVELSTMLGARHSIYCDPGQLEQTILNLVVNARDAMPSGGRLTLETRDVRLERPDGSLAAGDYVTLAVVDTGTGIPDDVMLHVFEPFFTTKSVGHGTGLGLSMVEGFVNQSGGAVRLETRVGEGTTFTVFMPRAVALAVPASLPGRGEHSAGGAFETVLVCDDDEAVRELLAGVLGLRAYRVLSARNGRHALEVAKAHEGAIHLLVTDVVMPELGGIDLATELRRERPELLVLFVSGYTEDAARFALALGERTHFLPKPFLPGKLMEVVCSILEQGSLRRELALSVEVALAEGDGAPPG